MKKNFLTFLFILAIFGTASAQKFGYIDSEYILKKMPEYQEAQKELDRLSLNWQKDIEEKKQEVDKLKADFQAEEVLLTEVMKEERLEEIEEKERELKEYQKKIFGFDGLIFLKRQELIKPVQDKLYEAVEKVAKTKRLQILFDKAGDLVMIYTNPIHDYTDYVLEELGLGDPNDTIK